MDSSSGGGTCGAAASADNSTNVAGEGKMVVSGLDDEEEARFSDPMHVPFTRDSPYFQEEVGVSYACIKGLTKMLSRVLEKAEQVSAASQELARRECDLADALLMFRHLFTEQPGHQLACACVSMGEALRELCETREIARNGTKESFLKPLQSLKEQVLQPCTAHVNDMVKTRSDYLAHLDKFLATKTLKPMPSSGSGKNVKKVRAQASAAAMQANHLSRKRERFVALSRAQRVYEMSRSELTCALNRAHSESQLDIAETIISTVYTKLSFHHQCHEIFKQKKGGMRHLQKSIAQARKDTARARERARARGAIVEKAMLSPAKPSISSTPPPPPPPRSLRRSLPLDAILNDPLLQRCFMKFSIAQRCAENVEFYQEVVKFRGFEDQEVKRKYARAIATVFLDEESSMTINIPGTMKESILDTLETENIIPGGIFDAAQREVANLMKTDALPRFLRSDEFKKVVDAQEEQYKNFQGASKEKPTSSKSKSSDALGGKEKAYFDGLRSLVPCEAFAERETPSSRRSLAKRGMTLLRALDKSSSSGPRSSAPSSSSELNADSGLRKQLRGIRSWARQRKHPKHELVSTVDIDAVAVHTDDETTMLSGTDAVARYAHFLKFEVAKEGFLRKMSRSVRKDWKRRWFILRGRCLWYVRDASCTNVLEESGEEGHLNEPLFVCECAISTVREVQSSGKPEHCFEILSPNRRTFLLQADGPADMAAWIEALRSGTERALIADEKRSDVSVNLDPDIAAIRALSPVCADCANRMPEWLSLNLGVMVCIECSGIHRSLGTHISKVRSITLDKSSASVKSLFLALGGNDTVNKVVWEHELERQTGWTRPRGDDSRDVKTAYIKSKYKWRGFCQPSSEVADDALLAACARNDVLAALEAISRGARVDGACKGTKRTALHVAAEAGAVEMCELLLQCGGYACISARDAEGFQPTDLALTSNHVEVLRLLAERGDC